MDENNSMYYCYKNNKTKTTETVENNLKNNKNWYEM